MSNVLEFFVKMKDMMSSGLVKIAQNADTSFGKVQTMVNKTMDRLDQLKGKVNDVDRAASKSSFFNGSLFRKLAGIFASVSLLGFAKDSINKAMEFGATKMSFQVLAGDPKKGNLLANHLNKLQQDTILGPEVFDNAKTMMGFGVGRKNGKTDIGTIEKDMRMLGDISMGNTEHFRSLTLAFSQTQSAGKLMGQDLLQYVNAGFNPLQTMSEKWQQFGLSQKTSVGDLRKMMEKGEISADMVTRAFELATGKGGMYENMMKKIGETAYGRMKVLEGAFESLKIKTGQTLMPIAEGLMKVSTYLIDNIQWVLAAVTAWGAYKAVTMVAATYQAILNGAMMANPIALVIAAIAALVVWIVALAEKYQGWADALKGLDFMTHAFAISQKAIWKDIYQEIEFNLKLAGAQMDEFLERIGSMASKTKQAFVDMKNGNFGKIVEDINKPNDLEATKRITDLKNKWASDHGGNLAQIAYANHLSEHGAAKIALAYKNGLFTPKKDTDVSPTDLLGKGGKDNTITNLLSGGKAKKDGANSMGAGGGQKSVVININKELVGSITVNASNVDAGIRSIGEKVQEELLRILNSGVALQ